MKHILLNLKKKKKNKELNSNNNWIYSGNRIKNQLLNIIDRIKSFKYLFFYLVINMNI